MSLSGDLVHAAPFYWVDEVTDRVPYVEPCLSNAIRLSPRRVDPLRLRRSRSLGFHTAVSWSVMQKGFVATQSALFEPKRDAGFTGPTRAA
jgi:hypothetical protein